MGLNRAYLGGESFCEEAKLNKTCGLMFFEAPLDYNELGVLRGFNMWRADGV